VVRRTAPQGLLGGEAKKALEAAMTGENQSAKVQASRVLIDALADPTSFEEREFRAKIAREIVAAAAAASAKISYVSSSESCATSLSTCPAGS
jgi:hypothetical protein